MFGKPSLPPPPPDEDRPPPPDYAAQVERELRIADNLRWAEQQWAEILSHYVEDRKRMRFV